MKYLLQIVILFSFCGVAQEHDTTLIRLRRSVKLAQNDSLKINALTNLGDYHITRDFRQAEQYLLEALKLTQKNKDISYLQQLFLKPSALFINGKEITQ